MLYKSPPKMSAHSFTLPVMKEHVYSCAHIQIQRHVHRCSQICTHTHANRKQMSVHRCTITHKHTDTHNTQSCAYICMVTHHTCTHANAYTLTYTQKNTHKELLSFLTRAGHSEAPPGAQWQLRAGPGAGEPRVRLWFWVLSSCPQAPKDSGLWVEKGEEGGGEEAVARPRPEQLDPKHGKRNHYA